jgi:Na+-transporting methylmalonyl-CoA/oxaloacetate decarboxylase gamma subunit
MMVDWGLATRIAGFGFLTVFAVLGILSLILWLVSLLLYRVVGKRDKVEQVEK